MVEDFDIDFYNMVNNKLDNIDKSLEWLCRLKAIEILLKARQELSNESEKFINKILEECTI